MDKRQVITAYRRGFVSLHECAQILGVDLNQLSRLMEEPQSAREHSQSAKEHPHKDRQSVNS
ncbi:hypothetical protein ACFO9Q_12285 [Paenibacillus sp. GCM10023252]|uniref:hypothetical protein n=1 Tax=Paenibacillus sp. GCM10023252 TaxID=3252649 RepID=UPI00360B1479